MIKEAWESYERDVLPPTAGRVQRVECRQAFYAGAVALFSGVMKTLSSGRDATLEDIAVMERLQEEMREYLASLR